MHGSLVYRVTRVQGFLNIPLLFAICEAHTSSARVFQTNIWILSETTNTDVVKALGSSAGRPA